MFVKNCWYVAGWNHEFAGGQLSKCSIINEPIVIYRKENGQYVALEDRCCHRAAPLSLGRLEGNDLRCLYHGLKFAPSGRCIEIPGQDKIPANACVRAYPVAEAHSWIWVWMGDPAKADPALIPSSKSLDMPGWESKSGHIEYGVNYQAINDNLLDFSHFGFVHGNSFGTSEDWAYGRPKITSLDRGVRLERWVTNQTPLAHSMIGNKIDIWNTYDYLLPGVLLMTTLSTVSGGAQASDMEAPDPAKVRILSSHMTAQAVTPVTDHSSRYFFSVLLPEEEAANGRMDAVWATMLRAFDEDRVVIEAQAKIQQLDPHRKLIATSFDAALTQFRRLIEKTVREESESTDR